MDFLRLTGGKWEKEFTTGKGLLLTSWVIRINLCFNLMSFVSQTLSIASFPLTTICGSKASVRFLFPLPGVLLHLLCNYCDITET